MTSTVKNTILKNLENSIRSMRFARDPLLPFMTTVLSEAQTLAKKDTKDGVSPPVDDVYVVRAIRTTVKQMDETSSLISSKNETDPHLADLASKKATLLQLLPPPASQEQIKEAVVEFIKTNEFANSKQAIGPTMKMLTEKFGDSLDKGIASKITQEVIASL